MKSPEWGGKSALDPTFLNMVKHWIELDGEVYAIFELVRAGGVKWHYVFTSTNQFLSVLTSPALRSPSGVIDVYRHPQFPVRGWVDNAFVSRALSEIQDGQDWFLLSFDNEIEKGQTIGAYGDRSHKALKQELQDNAGKYVMIGPDIHWPIPPDDYQGDWISAEIGGDGACVLSPNTRRASLDRHPELD